MNDAVPAARQKSLRILWSRPLGDWCVSTAVRTSVTNHGRFNCVSESPTQTRIGGALDGEWAPCAASRDGTQFFAYA